jgi:hypothetical protein
VCRSCSVSTANVCLVHDGPNFGADSSRGQAVDLLGYHLPSVAGIAATFAAIYGAFAKFDRDQSDDNRKFVRDWLLGLKVDDEKEWRRFFEEIFTNFFGNRHVSLRCIKQSLLLSIVLVAAIWTFWYLSNGFLVDDEAFRSSVGSERGASFSIAIGMAIGMFLSSLTVAAIADYFSLWKTRILLTRSNLLGSGLAAVAVVIGDATATILIYVAVVSLPATMIVIVFEVLSHPDEQLFHLLYSKGPVNYLIDGIIGRLYLAFSWPELGGKEGIWRMQLLAPLLTSAWLWVYLVVAYGMRGVSRVPSWLKVMSKVIDFDNHPVRTIGYVAATVGAAIVAMVTLI